MLCDVAIQAGKDKQKEEISAQTDSVQCLMVCSKLF